MTTAARFHWDRLSFALAIGAWVATVILFHSVWSFPFTPIAVGVPVVVAGLPLLVPASARRATRIAAALFLMAFAVLGVFSVGFLFLPALITMIVAASRQGGKEEHSRTEAQAG